jgi:N-formylglutamate amidohydrolase
MGEIEIVESKNSKHSGLFKPGVSGNPKGRPRSDVSIREIARTHTENALQTLVEIFNNKKAPASARVNAACALLDRGWGRPAQYVESVQLEMTFQDYLREFREQDEKEAEAGTI